MQCGSFHSARGTEEFRSCGEEGYYYTVRLQGVRCSAPVLEHPGLHRSAQGTRMIYRRQAWACNLGRPWEALSLTHCNRGFSFMPERALQTRRHRDGRLQTQTGAAQEHNWQEWACWAHLSLPLARRQIVRNQQMHLRESIFPVEGDCESNMVLWKSLKKISNILNLSNAGKAKIFAGTVKRVYKLSDKW